MPRKVYQGGSVVPNSITFTNIANIYLKLKLAMCRSLVQGQFVMSRLRLAEKLQIIGKRVKYSKSYTENGWYQLEGLLELSCLTSRMVKKSGWTTAK